MKDVKKLNQMIHKKSKSVDCGNTFFLMLTYKIDRKRKMLGKNLKSLRKKARILKTKENWPRFGENYSIIVSKNNS